MIEEKVYIVHDNPEIFPDIETFSFLKINKSHTNSNLGRDIFNNGGLYIWISGEHRRILPETSAIQSENTRYSANSEYWNPLSLPLEQGWRVVDEDLWTEALAKAQQIATTKNKESVVLEETPASFTFQSIR